MNNLEYLKSGGVEVEKALELWGYEESYQSALKEYMDSLPKKVADLTEFLKAQDFENYAILVHGMKSEGRYLGFMKQAEVFFEHEQKAKEQNKEFLEIHFTNLRKTVNQIIQMIKEYFQEQKNLLIADDSNIILNFIEKNVKEDYNVLKAEDGRIALELLKEHQIYGILLDLNMPNLNGFEVLDYLKEHQLLHELPVIVITGDDDTNTINKAFSYPIINILKKPFNDTNIKSALESIKNFYNQNSY